MKAFPTVNWVQQHGQAPNDEGMDLRDYFAAKAMEADITNWSPENAKAQPTQFWGYEKIADRAYTMADEMMKRRAHGIGE